MEIQIIKDKNSWNDWFFSQQSNASFTQSWEWGDILIQEGKRVERLAVVENGSVVAQAQVMYSQILFGWQYVFCPKGAVVHSQFAVRNLEIYHCLVGYLKKQNCIFFRVEPENKIHNSQLAIQKTIDINPSATLLLDLTKPDAELLANMHQKTRYNINLAGKKGLEIKQEKNLDVFWNLMNKTGSRDKFGLHSKKHYEQVLYSPSVWQLTACRHNIPVACTVFFRFGNTFTYLYGASDYEYRNLMAPYLLQWEGVKIGKNFGCAKYDFFGVAPRVGAGSAYEYDRKHQYGGVTRFKLGFGGAPQEAPGTFDVIIDRQKYFAYSWLRKLRRLF